LLLALCVFLAADAAGVNEQAIYSFSSGSGGITPITGLISDAGGNLYGATEFSFGSGGYGPGTIFELVKNGSSYSYVVLYTFTGFADGGGSSGSLARDSHGNLYGTAGTGGDNYKGNVFELSPTLGGSYTLTVLYSFTDGADGGYPYGGVILDKGGNLYGTANEGGLLSDCSGVGCGVVFKLSPGSGGTWTQTVLHRFSEIDGALPSSGLVFGPNGILYGTTSAGGTSTSCIGAANGCGTVFQIAPSAGGWTETTLHSFYLTNRDGAYPEGLTYINGKLFGVTYLGGTQSAGTVFELTLTKSGAAESVIHSFGTAATQPVGAVAFDRSGNLYGSAAKGGNSACYQGCGAIFELKRNGGTWAETILHEFTGGLDGASPYGTPILSATGLLGTAAGGGANGYGVVFELTR